MTDEPEFDPTASLPGPPEPWSYGSPPTHRAGPPWHMTDMIAAEPALAERIIARVIADGGATALAEVIRRTVADAAPIVVTGCGTSETAGTGVVAILREALGAAGTPHAQVVSEQAFELSLDPPARGLVIALSHEGGTAATIAALTASSAAGARTALLTVSRRSPAGQIAEIVIETAELDQSWCHTIGYVSPMLAAAAVGAELSGRSLDGNAVAELLAAGARDEGGAERIASVLGSSDRLLVIASGVDRAAGRELALKLEEACWLPSAYRDVETLLHGHLPATGVETGLVLVLVDRASRADRLQRARQALAAARIIGIRSAAILDADLDGELDAGLTPAGRLLVRPGSSLPAPVAALFATAAPLQLLTERFARARGTNPDLIRRDDPVYLRASEATGG